MQLEVTINLQETLVLPLNYNHIIQSIIYRALSAMPDYSGFLTSTDMAMEAGSIKCSSSAS